MCHIYINIILVAFFRISTQDNLPENNEKYIDHNKNSSMPADNATFENEFLPKNEINVSIAATSATGDVVKSSNALASLKGNSVHSESYSSSKYTNPQITQPQVVRSGDQQGGAKHTIKPTLAVDTQVSINGKNITIKVDKNSNKKQVSIGNVTFTNPTHKNKNVAKNLVKLLKTQKSKVGSPSKSIHGAHRRNEFNSESTWNFNDLDELNAILAVPVFRIIGYRPNIQYYLDQADAVDIWNNYIAVHDIPTFLAAMKPEQADVQLSEAQLELYKKYLIETGLIKLKPYRMIFSEKYWPKRQNLQWTVVNFQSNSSSSLNQHDDEGTFRKKQLSLKLLVPVLKVPGGLKSADTKTNARLDETRFAFRRIETNMNGTHGTIKGNNNVNTNIEIETFIFPPNSIKENGKICVISPNNSANNKDQYKVTTV